MTGHRFYLKTYGCRINQYETQIIREAWEIKGWLETASPEEAEIICINSCAITANAEADARQIIRYFKKIAPASIIILTGCAAQFFKNFKSLAAHPVSNPDFIIHQKDKLRFLSTSFLAKQEKPEIPTTISGFYRTRPVIKIQDGCSQDCSYCIVPQTRGRPASRPVREILKECQNLLSKGFSELVISGINLRQFHGQTAETKNFWLLMKYLAKKLEKDFGNKFRLRASSIDPALLNEEGLEILLATPQICPHLHLSLQHASTLILSRMGRPHYKPENILEKINLIRKNGVLGLGADILVGFPEENEDDFNILQDFLKELRLSYGHVFPFSPRPGTQAALNPNQIAFEKKKERARIIRELIAKSRIEFLQDQLKLEKFYFLGETKGPCKKGINEYFSECKCGESLINANSLVAVKPVGIKEGIILVERI